MADLFATYLHIDSAEVPHIHNNPIWFAYLLPCILRQFVMIPQRDAHLLLANESRQYIIK